VLSGLREQDQRLEAFDAGADDFVPKPFSAAELVERLRAAHRTQTTLTALAEARERADRLRVWVAEAGALLAHDLNNGLAVAMGNLEYLAGAASLADEDQADALAAAIRALRRMAGLVSNFTDIGRLEDGVLEPRPNLCQVAELLRTVASIHAPGNGGPTIEISCPDELVGWFDATLIERVIHNLLGNALRYVDRRGVVRLVARREESGDGGAATGWLTLRVVNSGSAIPVATQRLLFQKYGVGGDRRSRRGLGLYFCRLAAEAHGGFVSVESDDGLTCFTVTLPVPANDA
jgi:signal transduction histidine kinase